MGSFEGHLSYDVTPRMWVSLDGNHWFVGLTSLSGIANPFTRQASSRVGVTASLPVGKHQSFKVSYNDGGPRPLWQELSNLSVAWQFSWIGRP